MLPLVDDVCVGGFFHFAYVASYMAVGVCMCMYVLHTHVVMLVYACMCVFESYACVSNILLC